jgi:adenylate cyclase, class 2
MHTEIEAKFLHIDHEAMRARLAELGAQCVAPKRLMRRKNYDTQDNALDHDKHAWVRVRDEGDKITMSYKQLNDRTLHGTKEVNLVIDSFEQADAFLRALGLEARSYQETKRESWVLDGIEIELDEWPWIDPYLEIEGKTEIEVRNMATKLGLSWDDALHGSVEIAYQDQYNATDEEIDNIPVIRFEDPVPAVLKVK